MPNIILIVEDDPDSSACLSYLLRFRGYQVHTADNGLTALSEVEVCNPDLIISDITMPDMDGIEMLKVLRQTAKYKDIPVVILSAHSSGNLKEALSAGASQALRKPVDFDLFLHSIEQLLH